MTVLKSITVVDLANRILPSILDEEGSKWSRDLFEGHGIKFYLSDSVDESRSGIASLKSGTRIEYRRSGNRGWSSSEF